MGGAAISNFKINGSPKAVLHIKCTLYQGLLCIMVSFGPVGVVGSVCQVAEMNLLRKRIMYSQINDNHQHFVTRIQRVQV